MLYSIDSELDYRDFDSCVDKNELGIKNKDVEFIHDNWTILDKDAKFIHLKSLIEEDNGGYLYRIFQTKVDYDAGNILNFGPLEITLYELFENHRFMLEIEGNTRDIRAKLVLRDKENIQRYVICRRPLYEFLKEKDLSGFVKKTDNMLFKRQTVTYRTSVIRSELDKCDTSIILDELKKRYPYIKSKKNVMVGNQTIEEYVKQQLKGI